MKKIFAFIVGGLVSTSAWSVGSYDQVSDYSFDTVVSISTGKVELEDVDGDENIHSVSLALDFRKLPVEVELRFSTLQETYYDKWYVDDELVDEYKDEAGLDNWGISGKLDLSWSCREACAYLIAGYNMGEYSVDSFYNGEKYLGYSTDFNYTHVGAGFRYDFSPHLRATVEYLQYNIGKQQLDDIDGIELGEVDFGKATAWQAGIGYRF